MAQSVFPDVSKPVKLATTSLSGASVTFSAIPGNHKTLFLRITDVYLTSGDTVRMQINGSTASNYGDAGMRLAGTLGNQSSQGSWTLFYADSDNTLTAAAEFYFPLYSTTNNIKSHYGWNMAGAYTDRVYNVGVNDLSAICAAAITSITLFLSTETFSGGTANLFGVN